MDVPRLKEMNAYWREHPPLHEMVASYFGAGHYGDKKASSEAQDGSLDQLLANIPMTHHETPK